MLERLKRLSPVRIVTYLMFLVSLGMLAITTVMAINSFDVLQNWKLTPPDKRMEAGDRVIIASTYRKVREADGEAIRYIECLNKDKVFLRYEMNARSADRKAGKGGTGVDVTIPDNIPDLPATCKFSISIKYKTFIPWYEYPESQESKTFTLYPKSSVSEESESGESQRTNQTLVPATTSSAPSSQSSSASSSQNTTSVSSTPTNTSQNQQTEQQPEPSQPTLFERILALPNRIFGEG